MRKIHNYLIMLLCVIIIISIITVLNMTNGRYVRAQVFDCNDYNFYSIPEDELENMSFIEKIIIADGKDVLISNEEYEEFILFIEETGTLIKYNESCYELQIRMS
jgi:hypothetical protein